MSQLEEINKLRRACLEKDEIIEILISEAKESTSLAEHQSKVNHEKDITLGLGLSTTGLVIIVVVATFPPAGVIVASCGIFVTCGFYATSEYRVKHNKEFKHF